MAPQDRGNRLVEEDPDPQTRQRVLLGLLSALRNRDGLFYVDQDENRRESVRLVEKTPRNTLRIPFLKAVFPNCRFIFLYRQPHTNIASLIDVWNLPGLPGAHTLEGVQWRFLLFPGWREFLHRPKPEIAAEQWSAANQFIVNDPRQIAPKDWTFIRYEHFIDNPVAEIHRIRRFCHFRSDETLEQRLAGPLPYSQSTLRPPSPDKWRRYAKTLNQILPSVKATAALVESFVACGILRRL